MKLIRWDSEDANRAELKLNARIAYRDNEGMGPRANASIRHFGIRYGEPVVYLSDGLWAYLEQIDGVYAS